MNFPPASDIKRIRKSLDITQTELAAASGVSQSTIAKIERGRMSASYDTVVKLFETLDGMRRDEKKDLTAADVASEKVVTVQSTDKVHQASDLMRATGYSQLPVLKGDIPVGSISERGILELLRQGSTMEELGQSVISKVMDESYPVVSDSTPVSSVTSLMSSSGAVLVSKKGKIIGLITSADILKLI
ncbi:MAG TPA: CBS domain-containing protein [Euryarchaeota archaeon]|nr:CBS domain-containing protein [Euryarchaeota archaeon]